jgi:hypothetical protein
MNRPDPVTAMVPAAPGSRRLRVLVFVDHSIIVRHFISSGAFDAMRRHHDVRFVTLPEGHKRLSSADLSTVWDATVRLPEHVGRSILWKRLFQVEQLRRRADGHLRIVADAYAELIGAWTARNYRWLGRWPIWPVYRWLTFRRIAAMPNTEMEALFDSFDPDVVVHPTALQGPYLDDLIEIARRRGKPTVAIMNSWDNPALKRAMFGAPDWLLVWGEQTALHAVRYAGMDPARVVRFGAAQFEIYRSPPSVDRAAFRGQYGLPEDSRIVLYAGSSKDTDEYADLDTLETAIESGKFGTAAVIYRPHPWGNCGKEGWRIGQRRWKHIRFERSMEEYIRRVLDKKHHISTPEYRHTRDLLANVDVVVSPLSTILIEAALLGCVPLCVLEDKSVAASFDRSLPMIHFQEFLASPVLGVTCTHAMLLDQIDAALARARDPDFKAKLAEAVAWYVEPNAIPYGERLVTFVEEVAAGKEAV